EKMGCGRFHRSRPLKLSWLEWDHSARGIAQEVVEVIGNSEPAGEIAPAEPVSLLSGSTVDNQSTVLIEQSFQLRPNVAAVIKVPVDTTKEEAERLSGIVRNLWFRSSGGPEN